MQPYFSGDDCTLEKRNDYRFKFLFFFLFYFLLTIDCTFAQLVLPDYFNEKSGGLRFVENKGQIRTTSNTPAPEIRYQSIHASPATYYSNDKISFVYAMDDTSRQNIDTLRKLNLSWVGNGSVSSPIPMEQAQETVNFYLPHCFESCENMKTYKRLLYENIYNGIDMQVYSNSNGLKIYFVMKDPENVNNIQLALSGQDNLDIIKGNVHIGIGRNSLVLPKIVAYEVDPSYNKIPLSWSPAYTDLGNGSIGIESGANTYNMGNLLVFQLSIPYEEAKMEAKNMDWSFSVSEPTKAEFHDIAIDQSGNQFVSGVSTSLNFPVLHAYQGSNAGFEDFIFVKFSSSGELMWSTYYGGSQKDGIEKTDVNISLDRTANMFFEGVTTSKDVRLKYVAGAYYDDINSAIGDSYDQLIGKISPSGNLLWSTYFGGEGPFQGGDIAVDLNDDIYVTGINFNGGLPYKSYGVGSYFDNSSLSEGYIIKISGTNLSLLWCTGFGAALPKTIEIDKLNRPVIAGWVSTSSGLTIANNTGNPKAYQQAFGGGGLDGFIARFNNNLSLNWSTYFGGNDRDGINRISIDQNNRISVTGATMSTNFITRSGHPSATIFPNYQGSTLPWYGDIFIATFLANAELENATYFGSTADEAGFAITNDMGRNIFVGGHTSSFANFPFPKLPSSLLFVDDAFSDDAANAPDITDGFLVGYNSNFHHEWTTYIGGTNGFSAFDIVASNACYNKYLYLVGTTYSTADFPYVSRNGAYNGSSSGGAFLIRFNMQGTSLGNYTNALTVNENALKVYPNPVNEILYLDNTVDNMQFQVITLQGEVVMTGSIPGKAHQTEPSIDISSLEAGVYLINFISDQIVSTHKIIKN